MAQTMMARDALTVHECDELGITANMTARPIQAALVSAITFASGAALPLILAFAKPQAKLQIGISIGTLAALAILGAIGAKAGAAGILRGTVRVMVWGALAMAATAVVGWIFGTVV
jgi:VIT1/CCC1 family predicted Fe2+/Mn2+ transporter